MTEEPVESECLNRVPDDFVVWSSSVEQVISRILNMNRRPDDNLLSKTSDSILPYCRETGAIADEPVESEYQNRVTGNFLRNW